MANVVVQLQVTDAKGKAHEFSTQRIEDSKRFQRYQLEANASGVTGMVYIPKTNGKPAEKK